MSANASFKVNYLNSTEPNPNANYYTLEIFSNSMRRYNEFFFADVTTTTA